MASSQNTTFQAINYNAPQKGDFIAHYFEIEEMVESRSPEGQFSRMYFEWMYDVTWRNEVENLVMLADKCDTFADAINIQFSLHNHPFWNTRDTRKRLDLTEVAKLCRTVIDWRKDHPDEDFALAPDGVQLAASEFKQFYENVLSQCPQQRDYPPTFDDWCRWVDESTSPRQRRSSEPQADRELRTAEWVSRVVLEIYEELGYLDEGLQGREPDSDGSDVVADSDAFCLSNRVSVASQRPSI
jgi:hypothetical protein